MGELRMQADFTSTYASTQSTPKSRLIPDCWTPPSGASGHPSAMLQYLGRYI
jgi:hypothetical protein